MVFRVCPYCNKSIDCSKTYRKYSGHLGLCKSNPNYNKFVENIRANTLSKRIKVDLNCKKCNKGYTLLLTRKRYELGKFKKYCSRSCANSHVRSDESKKRASEIIRNSERARKARENKVYTKYKNFETKRECVVCKKEFHIKFRKSKAKYCSQQCCNKDPNRIIGGYRKGSGYGKHSIYKGFSMDSNFELEFAKFLDSINVEWTKNTKRFYFTWKGVKTYYIPDFYFPKKDLFYRDKRCMVGGIKKKELYMQLGKNEIKLVILLQKKWNKDPNCKEEIEKLVK